MKVAFMIYTDTSLGLVAVLSSLPHSKAAIPS